MAMTYADAAATVFGERTFTVEDFANRIGTPRAAKVLNEMKIRGLVKREGRGRYRLLSPSERPDLRGADWKRVRNTILEAPFVKAWVGPTAVELWTDGRYKVGPSPFIREYHVRIRKTDEKEWNDYLRANGVPTGRKYIGPHVLLEPVPGAFVPEFVHGEPVIPRREVVELIRNSPALYGDAEALLV